jgi:hypothetical protein
MTHLDPHSAPVMNLRQTTEFGSAIHSIVRDLDSNPNNLHSIPQICRKFPVKRRRLYDVINVLSAIGCASRNGTDEIAWHGRDRCRPKLREEFRKLDVHNPTKSLNDLFPPQRSIGLSALTISFLMVFVAIQVEIVDLREVSCLLSRISKGYKTTLSKLYQIATILGAVGLISRTPNVCEVRLEPPFTELVTEQGDLAPVAIETLLNRPNAAGDVVERRREEYRGYWQQHFRMR